MKPYIVHKDGAVTVRSTGKYLAHVGKANGSPTPYVKHNPWHIRIRLDEHRWRDIRRHGATAHHPWDWSNFLGFPTRTQAANYAYLHYYPLGSENDDNCSAYA